MDGWMSDLEDIHIDMLFGESEEAPEEWVDVFEKNENRESEMHFVQATAYIKLAIYNLKLAQIKLI